MTESACQEVQHQLLEHIRGKLAPSATARLEAHIANCPTCAAAIAEERAVNQLLQTHLPPIKAPERLQRALAAKLSAALASAADSSGAERALEGVRSVHSPAATSDTTAHASRQTRGADTSAADSSGRAPVTARAGASAADNGGVVRRAAAGRNADVGRAASSRDASVTRRGWLIGGLGAMSLAAAAVLGLVARGPHAASGMPREALNDHLRVLYAQNPVEIPNGGLHQVKPWFTGRIDFAPDISFVGDEEFPMLGGALGYFVDRKAASFVFKRRLHTISLFVFRSDGLEWPRAEAQQLGERRVETRTLDGFHQVYWEAEGLGHVLVSDVSSAELLTLTAKLLKR